MTQPNLEDMDPLKSFQEIAPALTSGHKDDIAKEEWHLPELQLLTTLTELDQLSVLQQMSAQSEEFLKNGEYKEPGLLCGVACKGKMPMVLPNPSEKCQTCMPMERKWVKLNQSGQTQIEVDRERKCLTMSEGEQIVSEWEIQKPKIQLEQEELDSGGQCPEEWRDQIQFDELEISDDSLPVVTAIVRKSKSPKYIVDGEQLKQ